MVRDDILAFNLKILVLYFQSRRLGRYCNNGFQSVDLSCQIKIESRRLGTFNDLAKKMNRAYGTKIGSHFVTTD